MISFEISDELREKLRIEAFKRNVTISAVIRMLLEERLDTIENTNITKDKDDNK